MNNQKLFLGIAIFLTVFILWDKWQITQTVDADGNVVRKTTTTLIGAPTANGDVPMMDTQQVEIDLPTMPTVVQKGGFTTVTTDLLTVEISHKGGTIQNAFLNNYPVEMGSEEKFQLLSDKAGQVFQAQSGLASSNDLLPTHLSNFRSVNTDYQMNGDTLLVPLTWQGKNGVQVVKNYHFKKGSYVVGVDYQIKNNTSQDIPVKSYVRLSRHPIDQGNVTMPTFTGGIVYDKAKDSVQKNKFKNWEDFESQQAQGGWIAMAQQYFIAAWIPNQNETQHFSAKVSKGIYKLTNANQQMTVAAGTTATLATNQLYVGPKEYGKIEKVATGLHYTLDYGFLDILASPLSWGIHKINEFIGSWGWSIILITFLIKLTFYPLSEKSYRSMAGMRKLAPRLAKLKETYGDDKQKMGQKTMELYKKEKINPASGCLPIMVQIPVFIAFYWMLLDTIELRQTAFWWMPDLSAMDPYYILPIVMGVSMFIQQKLNPPPADPIQAKIMMALPLVFTVMFLWFPSGLVLYWVFNNTLSILQQWTINKRING
ncbi:membrane protein insertase YidC [Bathymodiolus septemdierum thioautotrophic gill symbiont]|uniref:Membrane protein insertase YidC n=1 Tax=endosymbiont of Bathymodiolus septemdierum str. Myojin knoll TaxID=1303921 RepID=A0A0N7KBN0_9GAMM|nr:membrane protein insertase YidC [Bathymodiolus septemdierum thioautotrophic gill symbiont]BAS68471.1 preprotein translocase subunit YidC [endosymbiont of Bathymodiolus septemdierum str. Myojin knoll]